VGKEERKAGMRKAGRKKERIIQEGTRKEKR
jgi:hypothetical protein